MEPLFDTCPGHTFLRAALRVSVRPRPLYVAYSMASRTSLNTTKGLARSAEDGRRVLELLVE
jgi:hypothetical protein